jgi:hypothetical protein
VRERNQIWEGTPNGFQATRGCGRILRRQWCCGLGQGEENNIMLVDKYKKKREKPYSMTTNVPHNPCGHLTVEPSKVDALTDASTSQHSHGTVDFFSLSSTSFSRVCRHHRLPPTTSPSAPQLPRAFSSSIVLTNFFSYFLPTLSSPSKWDVRGLFGVKRPQGTTRRPG